MGTKQVRLDEAGYERIKHRKFDDETFSEAIDRLTDEYTLLDSASDRALGHARELEDGGVPLRISPIVAFEWFISVGKGSPPEANRRAFRRLTSDEPTVELTDGIARRAGELEGVHQGSDS